MRDIGGVIIFPHLAQFPKSAAVVARSSMSKRRRVEEDSPAPARKRQRLLFDYDLSTLSDELILKVLAYLPISDLALCQRWASHPVPPNKLMM